MSALMPRLFGDLSDWFEVEFPMRTGYVIRVEEFLGEDEYVLRAELPGLDPDKDIQITVNSGVLTIHAERQDPTESRSRTEFRYGVLQRSVRLPTNADEAKITARYGQGVLEITVPLTTPEPAGRQIPIVKSV